MIWDTDCWLERGLKRSIQDSFDFGVAKSIVAGIACLLYEENQGSNPPYPTYCNNWIIPKEKTKDSFEQFLEVTRFCFLCKVGFCFALYITQL